DRGHLRAALSEQQAGPTGTTADVEDPRPLEADQVATEQDVPMSRIQIGRETDIREEIVRDLRIPHGIEDLCLSHPVLDRFGCTDHYRVNLCSRDAEGHPR